jgi:hypothetical protein
MIAVTLTINASAVEKILLMLMLNKATMSNNNIMKPKVILVTKSVADLKIII